MERDRWLAAGRWNDYIDCMLSSEAIERIARLAANTTLPKRTVEKVLSEPTLDSEGRDALRLLLIIDPKSVRTLKGDALLDTLVQIQNDLRDAGEERFTLVEYATQAELDEDAGP